MAKDTAKDFSIEINSFRTVNTKDNPVMMKDDELPQLLNLMPIGQSLYTVPGYSGVLGKVASNSDIVRLFSVNISGTIYVIAATADGGLSYFDSGWTEHVIASPGTFSGDDTGPRFAGWENTHLLIIDPKGMWSWDGGAAVTAHTTLGAPAGESITVWQGRAFVSGTSGTNRTILWSVEGAFADFEGIGSGFQADAFSSLASQIKAICGSQDYLYVIGDHATHLGHSTGEILGNGDLDFSLVDAIPRIGSIFPDSVQSIANMVFSLSETGVHACQGASYELISSMLDGFLIRIDTSFQPVSFFANIYNKNVYCLLVRVRSPFDNALQKWIMCFYENRWFFVCFGLIGGASLDLTTAYQAQTSTGSVTYGAYGPNIVQLFTGISAITKRVRTKSMNYGTTVYDKQVLRVGAMISNSLFLNGAFSATMRAIGMVNTGTTTLDYLPPSVQWYTDTNLLTPAQWYTGTTPTYWFDVQDEFLAMSQCEGRGKRIALEYQESGANSYALTGFLIDGQVAAGW